MHSYELDGRGKVVVVLAATSVLLVWLLDILLNAVGIEPRWWLSLPSFGGFYGLIYRLFDHYLWRCGVLRKLRLIQVPDLNGRWTGEVQSSYAGGVTSPLPVSVFIKQRWSKLIIRLETPASTSHSVSATLRTGDLAYPLLDYMYVNEPRANALDTMNSHRGTAALELKDLVLEGDYYTGRGRREIGTLKLSRK